MSTADELKPTHFCDVCKQPIDRTKSRYTCGTCEFDMCTNCFFDEKTHHHPLIEKQPKKKAIAFFKYFDEHNSKQTVYLSDWRLAADVDKLKELNIKTVLTLMDLNENDDKKESINKMCKIYTAKRSDGKSVLVNNIVKNDIAYHLVNIMDLSDPSLLSNGGVDCLAEASTFIDTGSSSFDIFLQPAPSESIVTDFLKNIQAINRVKPPVVNTNNVLVHCELGQRRSPTAVLAWLARAAFGVDRAIKLISDQYTKIGQADWQLDKIVTGKNELSLFVAIQLIAVCHVKQWQRSRSIELPKWQTANQTNMEKWFKNDDPNSIEIDESSSDDGNDEEDDDDANDANDDDDKPAKKLLKKRKTE